MKGIQHREGYCQTYYMHSDTCYIYQQLYNIYYKLSIYNIYTLPRRATQCSLFDNLYMKGAKGINSHIISVLNYLKISVVSD